MPKTANIGMSSRRTRSSSRRKMPKRARKMRNAKKTRNSARTEGARELNADFAITPPIPKLAAAANANEYPSQRRIGAGPTEDPRAAEGSPADGGWGYR